MCSRMNSIIIFWIIIATNVYFVKCTGLSCCKQLGFSLDCSNCNLLSLPMSLMDNQTIEMDLSNNSITLIPEGSFENMTSLRKLDLSHNPLQMLTKDSFKGLDLLIHLVLEDDHWPPADLFAQLKNLKTLTSNYLYPTELQPTSLRNLTHLTSLKIAANNELFLGDEFKNLQNLSFLHLTDVTKIMENTLSNVPHIDTLQITKRMTYLSPFAFKHFTKLSSLRIVLNSALPIKQAFDAINNMNGPMLRELILDGTHSEYFLILKAELFNSSNFMNIKRLSMKKTGLISAEPDILYKLPSIQEISVGFNVIYPNKKKHSHSLELCNWVNSNVNIQAVDLNNIYQSVTNGEFENIFFQNSLDTFPKPPKPIDFPGNSSEIRLLNSTNCFKVDGIWNFLPISLKYVYARHIPHVIVQMMKSSYTLPLNNLLYIDFSHTKFRVTLPLLKGLNKLQGINLDSCGINSMHENQLELCPQLRYINLARNNLNSKNLQKIFNTNVSNLQWLDLSYNELNSLPPKLISSLKLLEYVSFHGNPLVTVTLDLQNNKKLKLLDMSACSLVNLTNNFQHQLDRLQSQVGQNLTLNISNNRFDCSCSTLSMIHWFQNTQVDIIDRETILCKYHNDSTFMAAINYEEMQKECDVDRISLLTIVLTPISLLCFGAVMLLMVYRFKWRLRWYVYKIQKNILFLHAFINHGDNVPLVPEKKYDVFISHNHTEDYQWVVEELFERVEEQWGFQVCLGQKDFVAGRPITENIIDAIENSRKTILVITPGFAESEWCEFGMQMALVKGRDCVVIIYKEEVPVNDMSKTLRWLMRSINYIEYNEDAVGQRMFWDMLKNTLESI